MNQAFVAGRYRQNHKYSARRPRLASAQWQSHTLDKRLPSGTLGHRQDVSLGRDPLLQG